MDYGSFSWKLYAQGGANVLFECTELPERLLRVRKPGSVTTKQIYEFYTANIKSEVARYGVEMDLVGVSRDFLESLQKAGGVKLKTDDSHVILVDKAQISVETFGGGPGHVKVETFGGPKRKIVFSRGTKYRDESTDLETSEELLKQLAWSSTLVEFKPKWLLQSRDAPSHARHCRTCALYMKRRRDIPSFCPLDLASNDYNRVKKALKGILVSPEASNETADGESHDKEVLTEVISSFLIQSDILDVLKSLQRRDKHGILTIEDNIESGFQNILPDLLIAMAARDCSLYIQVIEVEDIPKMTPILRELGAVQVESLSRKPHFVRAKLADFDFKDPQTKIAYWKGIEQSLREYYSIEGFRECEM
jgi:hypothetical protein